MQIPALHVPPSIKIVLFDLIAVYLVSLIGVIEVPLGLLIVIYFMALDDYDRTETALTLVSRQRIWGLFHTKVPTENPCFGQVE